MSLRKFPIAARLTGSFALIALIVALVGVLCLVSMGNMRKQAEEVETVWIPELRLLVEINQSFMRYRIYTLRALLAKDSSELSAIDSTLAELKGALEKSEQAFSSKADAEIVRLYENYRSSKGNYLRVQAEVMRLVANSRLDEANALVASQLNELANAVTRSLIALEEQIVERTNHSADESRASYESAFRQVVTFILIAAMLTVCLAYLITRSIVRPIREAVDISEVIASGDLTRSFKAPGNDEPARLLQALATMQLQLRNTIEGISNSSNQLASAAEELNAVTEDATRGLQRQNDEVQQAATAVNEMTAAVEEVARNAVSTSEQSRETSQIAGEGQQQVSRTVTSIDKLSGTIVSTATEVQELADKAQNISRVLDVIRAIAEQTNLLALNAAIEAARAGEQGRGFAVVADEVRALAHRTQQSTSEIEEMIGTIQQGTERAVEAMGISKTMAGSTLEQATAAGEALSRITSAIAQINERNLVIASASEEQASVAREVDRNLVNIRDLSTQSAAGAEQTSSSSRELSRLAVELNDLVNRFRI